MLYAGHTAHQAPQPVVAGKDPVTKPCGIRFSKPIHNVKEGRFRPVSLQLVSVQQTGCFILEDVNLSDAQMRAESWWSLTGSNR
jgi:hypothetical protein